MAIYSRTSLRQLYTGCLITALTLGVAHVQAQDPALEPMITFDQSHPLLVESPDTPMVSVYAGGHVIVNRGPLMRNPGVYEFTLSSAEFTEIVGLAQSSEIVNFSEPAAVAARKSASELIAISDPTTSIFDFNRLRGSSGLVASGNESLSAEVQTIQVDNVMATAEVVPSARSVQPLEALHMKMIELFGRTGN